MPQRPRLLAALTLVTALTACTTILGDDFEAVCDGLADCGECWDCSLNAECADERNACTSNPDCAGIVQCTIGCNYQFEDDSDELRECEEECENRPIWLNGRPAYFVLVDCAVCECLHSCETPADECP